MYEENYLSHFGVKGMKWGVRRSKGYYSTGMRSAIARRSNDKVDKGFKKWKENSEKKNNAIELGKKANKSRLAYERSSGDKNLKKTYKQDNKVYKKVLRQNTTYRKGAVKHEVGQDLSRKYLSEAKRVKKQLDASPNDSRLQKQYNNLMSKHDIERAKARRAPKVAEARSRKKASMKRTMTMTVKAAAASAVVAVGSYAVNRYLDKNNVIFNGKPIRINQQVLNKAARGAKFIKKIMKFV